MIRTDDVMSVDEIRSFYEIDLSQSIEPVVETHDGDWIKEIKDDSGYPFPPIYQWRFWKHEGIDD